MMKDTEAGQTHYCAQCEKQAREIAELKAASISKCCLSTLTGREAMTEQAKCELCGEPMPVGEEMFKFHGYSGDCSKPPLPKQAKPTIESLQAEIVDVQPIDERKSDE